MSGIAAVARDQRFVDGEPLERLTARSDVRCKPLGARAAERSEAQLQRRRLHHRDAGIVDERFSRAAPQGRR